jgi:integrase
LDSDERPKRDSTRILLVQAIGYLLEQHTFTAVNEFGPVQFRMWIKFICGLPKLSKRGENKGKPIEPVQLRYCETTIKKLIFSVKQIWKWGVSTGRIKVELLQGLETVPLPRREETRPARIREAADPADVQKTIEHLRGPVRAMVLLQLHTGARPEEVMRLRVRDVKREGKVRISGAGSFDCDAERIWVVAPAEHKTTRHNKARAIFFGKTDQLILGPFLDRDEDAYLFSPQESMSELQDGQRKERLERREGGSGGSRKKTKGNLDHCRSRYDGHSYRQAIERACVKAGVPVWTPYQLRHLAAEQIDELYGAQAVQEFLGHSDAKTTERYRKQRAAVKRVAHFRSMPFFSASSTAQAGNSPPVNSGQRSCLASKS